MYEKIDSFLKENDYDVRKSRDARWIDQKCTYDVLSIIADCVLQYVNNPLNTSEYFTTNDIWRNPYTVENVQNIFSKPDVIGGADNEYDKYFAQPLKLLSYSKILILEKKGRRNYFKVNNKELLKHIALRDSNSLDFLTQYIVKVLTDSGLFFSFYKFLQEPTNYSYTEVKNIFTNFTIKNTSITGEIECRRIFTKVINPLAFKCKTKGSIKGRLSFRKIILSDLQYNRENFRDSGIGKDKDISRQEYERLNPIHKYNVNRAVKAVKEYNDYHNLGMSEVKGGKDSLQTNNTYHAHHIFSKSEYPSISDYLENLIILTPNQHFGMAHPYGDTHFNDPDYMYVCLIAKYRVIKECLEIRQDEFYDFEKYKIVLNTGFCGEYFNFDIQNEFCNFLTRLDCCINYKFGSSIQNNIYKELISENMPLI